jgi:hypothetical protein
VQPIRPAWPLSAILLLAFGVTLIGIGLFFAVLRPSLLPEDARFVGLTLAHLQAEQPRMAAWLLHVFRVLGGYAAASGVLTVTIAVTAFRRHDRIAGAGALLGGAVSIGWMAIVNFMIDSDFKWMLLVIALLWAGSMVLFWIERRASGPIAERAGT